MNKFNAGDYVQIKNQEIYKIYQWMKKTHYGIVVENYYVDSRIMVRVAYPSIDGKDIFVLFFKQDDLKLAKKRKKEIPHWEEAYDEFDDYGDVYE